jgi:hypothetical protein
MLVLSMRPHHENHPFIHYETVVNAGYQKLLKGYQKLPKVTILK